MPSRTGRFKSKDGTVFLWRRGHNCALEVSYFSEVLPFLCKSLTNLIFLFCYNLLIPHELVDEASPMSPPVVTYHRHKRYLGLLRIKRYPSLVIESCVLHTLDSLIRTHTPVCTSFCCLLIRLAMTGSPSCHRSVLAFDGEAQETGAPEITPELAASREKWNFLAE